MAADSSESENDSPVKKSANKKKSLAADSSESENDSPVKKSANKKKSLAADSSESENDSPVKKSANKKKSLAADSSDSENDSPVKQTKRSVLDSSGIEYLRFFLQNLQIKKMIVTIFLIYNKKSVPHRK